MGGAIFLAATFGANTLLPTASAEIRPLAEVLGRDAEEVAERTAERARHAFRLGDAG